MSMLHRISIFALLLALPSIAAADCPSACDASGGDVNGDGSVNIADFSLLGNYLSGVAVTICPLGADVNGDGSIGVADLLALSLYLYSGGDAPVDPVCDPCPETCADIVAGDVNSDGDVDIADTIAFGSWLWAEGDEICLLAADVNQDGNVDIADYASLFAWLFGDGDAPEGPDCD